MSNKRTEKAITLSPTLTLLTMAETAATLTQPHGLYDQGKKIHPCVLISTQG